MICHDCELTTPQIVFEVVHGPPDCHCFSCECISGTANILELTACTCHLFTGRQRESQMNNAFWFTVKCVTNCIELESIVKTRSVKVNNIHHAQSSLRSVSAQECCVVYVLDNNASFCGGNRGSMANQHPHRNRMCAYMPFNPLQDLSLPWLTCRDLLA